ncbi:MAG: hypothetical protein J6B51_02195 [Clostridia bacterium]|nr:hypothetical protein [Clostridia bacterium]
MDKEYIIREKYCPSKKRNVPVMVFADSSCAPKCWDSAVFTENCTNIPEKTKDRAEDKKIIM